jgi:hypothetical protein
MRKSLKALSVVGVASLVGVVGAISVKSQTPGRRKGI